MTDWYIMHVRLCGWYVGWIPIGLEGKRESFYPKKCLRATWVGPNPNPNGSGPTKSEVCVGLVQLKIRVRPVFLNPNEIQVGLRIRIPKSDPSTWLFYKYMYRVGLFGYQGSGLVFNPHEIQVGFRFWMPESDPSSRLFEPAQNFATQGLQLDTPHWFTYWLCVCQSMDKYHEKPSSLKKKKEKKDNYIICDNCFYP